MNRKLIYCSISGFGQTGPYRDMPGYDTIGQARSGLLSLLTDPDKPQGMGISFSDHLTGMYACYGILAALVNRSTTGEGQQVETSLLRASVSFVGENAARYFETGEVPRRAHRTKTAGVFAFVDRDGLAFVLHMSSPDKFWRAMFEVVGKPEWADDVRFRDRKGRIQHHDALSEMLQAIFEQGRREDWLRRLQEKDVPAAPLNTLDEVFADPQVQHLGIAQTVESPTLGPTTIIGQAFRLSRTPSRLVSAAPECGTDTDDILRELGYGTEAIAALPGFSLTSARKLLASLGVGTETVPADPSAGGGTPASDEPAGDAA
jgi:crotonobetainyl-CoA:carnitine CoA-transferase CaiB-like acyl-CoA transferase